MIFSTQFILRKRSSIGNRNEGADQVAIKVINLKTALPSFVRKFLPREIDVARKLGLVNEKMETILIWKHLLALKHDYLLGNIDITFGNFRTQLPYPTP